jgi:hypothetical protein
VDKGTVATAWERFDGLPQHALGSSSRSRRTISSNSTFAYGRRALRPAGRREPW